MAAIVFTLSGCRPEDMPTKADTSPDNPNRLVADQEIVMDSTSFGCEFEYKLVEAAEHKKRGESSAFFKIVGDSPWCFYGSYLKEGQTWTVMQIRGNLMQIAQTRVKQFETDRERYHHAYWTATSWGRQAPLPSSYPEPASAPASASKPHKVKRPTRPAATKDQDQ